MPDHEDQTEELQISTETDRRSRCINCGVSSSMVLEYMIFGAPPLCSKCMEVAARVYVERHGEGTLQAIKRYTPIPRKVPIPEEMRWEVFERDGFACKQCGSKRWLRADHVIPESAGGPTTLENLQTLCRSCNSRKGIKAVA